MVVIPIDIIIINVRIENELDKIIISIIGSLEKNPDINGIPIKAVEAIPKEEEIIGELNIKVPIFRMSWYEEEWINTPPQRNIIDLNKAWIIKWKNANEIIPIAIANIIIAICLRVDKAIIFFISISQLADILA